MPGPFRESQGFVHTCMLLSSWLVGSFYTLECILAVSYFAKRNRRTRYWCDCLVAAILLVDAANTAGAFAQAYMGLITNSGTNKSHYAWPVPLLFIGKGLSILLEHSYLTYRLWRLSKKTPVVILISVLSVATCVLFVVAGVGISRHSRMVHDPWVLKAQTASFGLNIAVDVLLPATLIWELRKYRLLQASTSRLVRRLSIVATATGIAVTALNTTGLVLFLFSSSVVLPFVHILGRLYALVVLFTLTISVSHDTEPIIRNNDDIKNTALIHSINVRYSTRIQYDEPLPVLQSMSNMADLKIPSTGAATRKRSTSLMLSAIPRYPENSYV